MPQILVNYKYNKKEDRYSILPYDKVYADLPIAIMQDGIDYDEILIIPINNTMTVVDKEEYLSRNKMYYLKLVGKEKLKEVTKEEQYDFNLFLPIDTNVSLLRYINGQILLMEKEEVKEK